ncbi:glycosyltransferase [Cohnella soli]|uniref:Glycosyltransferase n=1 Tax=Cohnella soli TaxID=425005 RepID=A0ABW0HWV2_9BACL
MNVLFLSWAYPKKNTPYLGIWAHQQALALQTQGVEVEVVNSVPYVPSIAGALSPKLRDYSLIPAQEHYDGVKVHHPKFLRTKPNSLIDKLMFRLIGAQSTLTSRALARALEMRRFHVVHAHNLFPDGAVAYRLFRKYGIPYVLTLHDVDRFNSFPDRGTARALAEAIVAHAKKVLVVSTRVQRNMSSQVPKQRLEVLYNTYWTEAKAAVKQRQNKIVTIASLIDRKGVHYLLRAFRRVVDKHGKYELVIIGNGREMSALSKLADELGIADKVTFTGTLEHAKAMDKLSEASIFCLPSWDEAFGVAYAEAMSFGIPVVGCKGEGIADIVTSGLNGMLVEPRNEEQLAEALFELIEQPAMAERIGLRGREAVQQLQPDVFAARLVDIYEDALCRA